MPIHFRCVYCQQLLGIARRKAGTVVRCPTCAGQVLVPNQNAEGLTQPTGEAQPIFERSDFDALFQAPHVSPVPSVRVGGTEPAAAPGTVSPEGAWGTHAEPPFDHRRLNPVPVVTAQKSAERLGPGIVLSPTQATLLTVAAIVMLALSFIAGLLIDRFLL
jgi:hypothetical protein